MVFTSLYLQPQAHMALKELSETTRVPVAAYLREAIDDLLAKHGVSVPQRTRRKK